MDEESEVQLNKAQKLRKLVFGRLFHCCKNASWQQILYGRKPHYFTFKWYQRIMHFVASSAAKAHTRETSATFIKFDARI